MMIGVGVLSLLTLLMLRALLAAPFLVQAMRAERKYQAIREADRKKAELFPHPYDQSYREFAEYQSRMSAYYSHHKWYFFWYIFKVWEPLTIPRDPDVGRPQVP
jgi:hypothetical protein